MDASTYTLLAFSLGLVAGVYIMLAIQRYTERYWHIFYVPKSNKQ